LTNSCYSSSAIVGKSEENINAVAIGIGYQNKAKAPKDSWIVLSEYVEKDDRLIIKAIKSVQVDGVKILADTFYILKKGKFVVEVV